MAFKTYAFRLLPGTDLKLALEKLSNDYQLRAAWIMSCVGSLTQYHIRFANQGEGSLGEGHFEILSLAGTLGRGGSHLHICIGDRLGQTIGGHLLPGCIIYTTAEIIIATDTEIIFNRELDPATGWKELKIESANSNNS